METEATESSTSSTPSSDVKLSEAERIFIEEHGRLYRPVEHPAFDPFRRRVLKIPKLVPFAQTCAAVILVPLRLFVAAICILLSYIIVQIFGPKVTKQSVTSFEVTKLPLWKRAIVRWATFLLARGLLFALGFWRIKGREHPDYNEEEALKATILSNHSSLADPCVLAYLYAPAFVAKFAVYSLPGIGHVGAAQHAFYINRVDGSGFSVTDKIVERQKMVLGSDGIPPVAIFPEGTTTSGKYLLRFRTGAFVAGTPVAPVLFRYAHRWFSPAYETIQTGRYVVGLLTQFANSVEYYKLPVYYPSKEEKDNPRLYADNVHALMLEKSEEAFGMKCKSSDSDYVDKIEFHSIVRGKKLKKGLQLNKDR